MLMTKRITKYGWNLVILLTLILTLVISWNLTATNQARAGDSGWWNTVQNGGLNQVGKAYGNNQPRDARFIVVDIIKVVLGFLGIITIVLILYAGFKWMTAGGNEEKISDAKKILIASVIGLVIILSAYVLANFIISRIYGAVSGGFTPVPN
jgi:hypothetical protein